MVSFQAPAGTREYGGDRRQHLLSRGRTPWVQAHERDLYVKRSRLQGFRSRAVHKLIEIDERERLLSRGDAVVELGAAPGGWTQYVLDRVGPAGKVVAIDLCDMGTLPGCELIRGDFSLPEIARRTLDSLPPEGADRVLCDAAPGITGQKVVDEEAFLKLNRAALVFIGQVLKNGGDALIKTFAGSSTNIFREELARCFASVRTRKPAASRGRSREFYMLAKELQRQ